MKIKEIFKIDSVGSCSEYQIKKSFIDRGDLVKIIKTYVQPHRNKADSSIVRFFIEHILNVSVGSSEVAAAIREAGFEPVNPNEQQDKWQFMIKLKNVYQVKDLNRSLLLHRGDLPNEILIVNESNALIGAYKLKN